MVDAGIWGFKTRPTLAPEHTNMFLETSAANTQEGKQRFFQLHLFMLHIKTVFTEGHTVVVFVQGQLCFNLGKQAREGINKGKEWRNKPVETPL